MRIRLKFEGRDSYIDRFVHNISQGGLFVYTHDPAPVGHQVDFSINIPESSTVVQGVGVVRWARSTESAADSGEAPGFGLEFVGLSTEDRALLDAVVAQYGGRELNATPETQTQTTSLELLEVTERDRATVILDLCGGDLQSWLMVAGKDGGTTASPHTLTPRLSAGGGDVFVFPGGDWVPCLPQLLDCRWLSPRAKLLAHMFDLQLSDPGDGELRIHLDGELVRVTDALMACVDDVVARYKDMGANDLWVVVPAQNTSTTREWVEIHRGRWGFTNTRTIPDALAVVNAGRTALTGTQLAITIQVTAIDTRLSLVGGSGDVLATRILDGTGLWETDRITRDRVKVEILRNSGIDTDDRPEMLHAIVSQIFTMRVEGSDPDDWHVAITGSPIEISAAMIGEWLHRPTTHVLLACESLMAEFDLRPKDLATIIVASDEMPWPGLLPGLANAFDMKPFLAGPGPWARIEGATALPW